MKSGRRLIVLAVSMAVMAVATFLVSSPADAAGRQDPANVPTVSIVPATATDMPIGKATYAPTAAAAADQSASAAASWVCTVYADDIWQSGDWAEGDGSQICSGVGFAPEKIRTQIQRHRWWGWETVKTDSTGWSSSNIRTLLPAYDCSDDGTFTYRLVTTGWAQNGAYSQDVQSANDVRFTC